jgi:hypothetical protein
MARSTGIVIATGAITLANDAIFAPALTGGKKGGVSAGLISTGAGAVNWRIIPATAGLALALAGLERIAPAFAVGLAWLSLATVLIVPFGNAPTPLENATRLLGYTKAVT